MTLLHTVGYGIWKRNGWPTICDTNRGSQIVLVIVRRWLQENFKTIPYKWWSVYLNYFRLCTFSLRNLSVCGSKIPVASSEKPYEWLIGCDSQDEIQLHHTNCDKNSWYFLVVHYEVHEILGVEYSVKDPADMAWCWTNIVTDLILLCARSTR